MKLQTAVLKQIVKPIAKSRKLTRLNFLAIQTENYHVNTPAKKHSIISKVQAGTCLILEHIRYIIVNGVAHDNEQVAGGV